jgi:hypothetical protein
VDTRTEVPIQDAMATGETGLGIAATATTRI